MKLWLIIYDRLRKGLVMIIYNRLFLVILNFVCMGINVTAFFLVVRAVMCWKEVSWLKPFDDA